MRFCWKRKLFLRSIRHITLSGNDVHIRAVQRLKPYRVKFLCTVRLFRYKFYGLASMEK
jgi:hypothetical protein